MEKVGIEERRIDPTTKSSFSPCMYKPTKIGFGKPYTEKIESPEANIVTETGTSGMSSDSLFLPCHYFDYGAGTSTGGYVMSLVQRHSLLRDIKSYQHYVVLSPYDSP